MNDSSEFLHHVEAIFQKVMEASESLRSAVLQAECQGNAELREEVVSLMKACELEELLTASSGSAGRSQAESLRGRRRIGPYELDRLVGRGGMGAVYLAHRADGQFEQQVAIKLIDLPFVTELFRGRFRQERQILARLTHPNIARMLDGGVSNDGELYLAMEYVEGLSIQKYCVQHSLTIRERIELFKSVCAAVRFAHQNLVVHRDLKPANIIVLEDGTPKLLDFGTAKLLSPVDGAAEGEFTRHGVLSFTPQYASPEQILGHPISTSSDIYSLGVLLYVLLAGVPPYELKDSTTDEMIRVICQQQPPKPSSKAAPGLLDSDIDAIVLKALRKEPEERYGSVDQLLADLQAYLDGRAVSARQGNFRYLAGKFIRRNKLAITAATLLCVSVLTGIGGIAWQARIANVQRRKAEARADDLRKLSNQLLSDIDGAIQKLPGSTAAQKLLVSTVLEHLDRMSKDAQGDRPTQLDLVNAYTRLGNLQGNTYYQSLGDSAGAFVSLGKAQAIAEALVASDKTDREAIRALAMVEQSRSEILWVTGKTSEAIPVLQRAVKRLDQLVADPNASPALLADAAGAYGDLGDEWGQPNMDGMNSPAEALSAYKMSLNLVHRALSIDPAFLRGKRALGILMLKIGTIETETDPAQAIRDLQIALQRADDLPTAEREGLSAVRVRGLMLLREANALAQLGRYSDASQLFAKVIEMNRRFAAADPQDWRAPVDLESALNDEAAAYESAADPALGATPEDRRRSLVAAEKLLTEAIALIEMGLKQQPSNDSWKAALADVQVRLGTLRSTLHGDQQSNALTKEGLAAMREMASKDPVSPAILNRAAIAFLTAEPAALRDPQFAASCAERVVAISHGKTPSMLLTVARAYRAIGQVERSRAAAKEGLAILPVLQPGSVKPNIRKLLEKEALTSS